MSELSAEDEPLEGQSVKEQYTKKVHWSFWLIGVFSLFWYAMSCLNFFWQLDMTSEKLAMLSEAQNALIVNRPFWAAAGFAVASIAGTLGCILLLFKRSVSLHFLLISLIGLIVSMLPVYGVIYSGVSFSVFEFFMYVIATPLLGLFLVWYAKYAKSKAWLR